ncbi:MAG: ribonuclease III [Caldilineaceae bacterium]|nr:ribonuclease III [Caldilineaceae bacterium]
MFDDFQAPLYFERYANIFVQDRDLLRRAFTHRSYLNEAEDAALRDNERLEFLGDAVLGFIVSEYLFDSFSDYDEGELTRLRSMAVRRDTLARVADSLLLGESLLLGKGEEESGGRNRQATLCAVCEAVIGAVFLDQGIDVTQRFILKALDNEIAQAGEIALIKDSKSHLQEYVQSVFNVTPRYKTLSSTGPDHAKSFVLAVTIAKLPVGVGQGHSKQEAAKAAAAMALDRLGRVSPEYLPDELLEKAYPVVSIDEVMARVDERTA